MERLQADLRLAGLACWRLAVDDEEVFPNDGISSPQQRLTYYDHLVLVCSEHSLGSPYGWRLFEQIAQKHRSAAWNQAVIPLVLDDDLYAGREWLRLELLKDRANDFRGWPREAVYQ